MAEPSTTERTVCYRHPRVETGLSCVTCERPICTDCLVQGPVGHRCPECAGVPTGASKQVRRVSKASGRAPTGIVTYTLIALNAVVFMAQLITAGDISGTSGEVFVNGALFGPLVADGEWWRLITSAFLH